MASPKGIKHSHYPRELKEQAVRMFLEQGMTRAAITHALGIRDPGRVKVWLCAYRRDGTTAFTKPLGRPRKGHSTQSELERLRMENILLKKFHTELRKAALAKRNIG